jgi:hypothetical protein
MLITIYVKISIFCRPIKKFFFFRNQRLQGRRNSGNRERPPDRRPAVSRVRPSVQMPPRIQTVRTAHAALPGQQVELFPTFRLRK